MSTSRGDRSDVAKWANLENILLGRTLHVQGLSPLHVPTLNTRTLQHDVERDDEDITSADLQHMAEQMQRFLTLRVSNIVVDSSGPNNVEQDQFSGGAGQRRAARNISKGIIRQVRASFVDVPEDEEVAEGMDLDDHTYGAAPRPFAIEIEIQPPREEVVNVYADYQKSSGRSRTPPRQYAHFLFLSTSKHATSTHYPVLLWKAPPAAVFGSSSASALLQTQDQGGPNANDLDATAAAFGQPALSARVLVAHALDFVTRYFDCHLSQQGPLSSLRAAHLERTAEAIVRYHRRQAEESEEYTTNRPFAIDVGYALPSQLASDIETDAPVRPGPAPDLNLISLEVPAEIVQKLMRDTDSESPFLPALQHYIASVTSLQLSRLTLVRVGIANVYLGAPTNTTLVGTRLGPYSAEIRLKISPLLGNKGKRRSGNARSATSLAETQRIAMVVRSLVHMAEVDDW